MKSTFRSLCARGAAAIFVCVLGAAAQAQVNPVATAGVTLTPTGGISTPMSVAWIPAFSRYYGGSGGGTNSPMTVFSAAGLQVGQGSTGVDQRGVYFNSNTAFLESVSFNACCASGAVSGVQNINLDVSGNLVGTNAQVLAGPIAPLSDSQTMPSYDPATDHLFAKQTGSGVVNVVNRTTGASAGTITLNLAAAAVTSGDVSVHSVGFTGVAGSELAIYDFTNHRVLVFNLAGNFIGASALPAIPAVFNNTDYGTGYGNGQFFVFDDSAGAFGSWRGFIIFGAGPVTGPTPVPTITGFGIAALGAILALLAMLGVRRRARA